MIEFLHFLLAVNLFTAALAGAVHFKFVRKVRHLSFIYFGWSLTGQIIALPLLILTSLSLCFALFGNNPSLLIAGIHLLTLPLFLLILWHAWQSSRALAKVASDKGRASLRRFLLGALFPVRLPKEISIALKTSPMAQRGGGKTLTSIVLKLHPIHLCPL